MMYSLLHIGYHKTGTSRFQTVFYPLVANGRDFIKSYCAEHALCVPDAAVTFSAENVGYRGAVLQLARLAGVLTRQSVPFKYYLVHIPGWYPRMRRLLDRLNRVNSPARPVQADRLLPRRHTAFIADRYRNSNRQLAAEFDLPLERYGYPL